MNEKEILQERIDKLLAAGGKVAEGYQLSPRYMYKNGAVVEIETPANEWREEIERFEEYWLGCLDNLGTAPNDTHTDFKRGLQNLLDQHTAHLVAKIEGLKDERLANAEGLMDDETRVLKWKAIVKNEALDQAIDIINKRLAIDIVKNLTNK
jgi:hypothetical protein